MRPEPAGAWLRAEADGVRTPRTVAPEDAALEDTDEVVGVVVNGFARAYPLRILADPQHHVINDLIGGSAVSVAYCDQTECIRTYTGPGPEPLQIAIAGLREHGLVIRVDGVYFDHKSGQVVEGPPQAAPLLGDAIPWTRTSWAQWRKAHPQTEVSVGNEFSLYRVERRQPAR